MKKIEPNGLPAFQGDTVFRRVDKLPDDAKRAAVAKEHVVAHSETGHHHIATGKHRFFTLPDDPMRAFLVAKGPVIITHHRSTDTHETFELYNGPGSAEVVWEIGRQREYVPEGWRRVED